MTWPLTPWYPATTKPARPGLYLTALGGEQVIARWTGSVWCWLDGIAHALTGRRQPAAWRRWLDAIGVRYVTTPRGIPLVYRDRLSPAPDASRPDAVLNLDALRKRRA